MKPDIEESTRGSTAGKLVHDESAGNSYLDMESVKEDIPGLRNDTKEKNKEEPVERDYHLKERSKINYSKEDGVKGDNLDKSENQKTKVAVKRHKKHESQLEDLLKLPDDREFNEKSNLLSPPEQKEVSDKAVENASKSAADSKSGTGVQDALVGSNQNENLVEERRMLSTRARFVVEIQTRL